MTIKELANVAGCNRETVLDVVKKLYPNSVHKGVKTRLNLDQSKEVMNLLPKKKFVQPVENSISQPMENSIGQIVSETIKGLLPVIQTMIAENNKVIFNQISQPQLEYKQDYFSLKAWHIKMKQPMPMMSELRILGKGLTKLSLEMNKEIRKVDDESYGQVNSYHVEVLKKYFEI